MPYERKGKCVYKPSGKKVGCSDTIEKAKKYIKALYSSEGGNITKSKIKEIVKEILENDQGRTNR